MNEDTEKHLILYCDGGSRPNPGKIGWGIHGYEYIKTPSKSPKGLKTRLTDRGYSNNEYGIDVTATEYYDFVGNILETSTSSYAELMSITTALSYFKDYLVGSINIYTDSEYIVQSINNGLNKWTSNGWKKSDGTEVLYTNEWLTVQGLLEYYKSRKVHVKVHWVKGHSTNYGNYLVDLLATVGVVAAINKEKVADYTVTTAKKYWGTSVDVHPLLKHDRLYFNTFTRYNTPGTYYVTNTKSNEKSGVTVDILYAILKFKEPVKAIEAIRIEQANIVQNFNQVGFIDLNTALQKDIYPYIHKYGQNVLLKNNRFNIVFPNQKQITNINTPSGIVVKVIEKMEVLEDLLNIFLLWKQNNMQDIQYNKILDITPLFYDTGKKTQLLKTISNTTKQICIDYDISIPPHYWDKNINLSLTDEFLDRNILKAIEFFNPKIYLHVWITGVKTLCYGIVVDTDEVVGMWHNPCTNQLFLD